ncbi:MAG: OFA family MFS transporter [Phycisphaerae bacterium]|jgi:OFA family oxalate/formate antiporter-like MFS transporter
MSAVAPAAFHPAAPAVSRTARYQVLVGALLIQLILGTIYGYSIFWEPLDKSIWPPVLTQAQAQALAARGTPAAADAVIVADEAAARRVANERQGYLKYSFSICVLAFALTMIFAGRLQDIIGPRYTALIGGVLLALGFLISGQMHHQITFLICHALLVSAAVLVLLLGLHALTARVDRARYPIVQYLPHAVVTLAVVCGVLLGQEYVSHGPRDKVFLLWGTIGLIAGAGIGFAYVCPIAALVKWFPQYKGLMAGIAVAGFGFGAYIFSLPGLSLYGVPLGAAGFIKAYGITALFSVHALICLLAVGLGAALLRNPPAQAPAAPRAGAVAGGTDLTWQETLRTGRFYLVWFMYFTGAMAGLMVIGILKPFAGAQLTAAAERAGLALTAALQDNLMAEGAKAVGILAIFNAIGRIFWGLLSDRIGRTPAMILMFVLQGATLLVLTALDTRWLLAAGAAAVGFNYGGLFALFPSLTADLFGSKNLGANYGWVFTSYGIAGVVGIWAGNLARAKTGSYFAAFALAAGLCFVSAVLAVVLGRAVKKPRAAG